MNAADFDCIGQSNCLAGYSNVLTLTVPKPAQTYRASVMVLRKGAWMATPGTTRPQTT
jgi:hypothetical protein